MLSLWLCQWPLHTSSLVAQLWQVHYTRSIMMQWVAAFVSVFALSLTSQLLKTG